MVADIGGTTTDLALILSGKPLLASKGAKLGGFLTHVRAFSVRSIAVGGDSVVRVKSSNSGTKLITVGPDRAGPAYCMGGEETTPTDALKVLELIDVGNPERAREAIKAIGSSLGKSEIETASLIVDKATQMIAEAVNEMFLEWAQEPAYRIWEVLQEKKARPENVVGIGGGREVLLQKLRKNLMQNLLFLNMQK
ncbi:MAG: hypothetical protein NHB15_03865 [Methanosarcina barkeri]|nr:hypothetical protein [Methanosarcina sp. ERenArc_MAG2]